MSAIRCVSWKRQNPNNTIHVHRPTSSMSYLPCGLIVIIKSFTFRDDISTCNILKARSKKNTDLPQTHCNAKATVIGDYRLKQRESVENGWTSVRWFQGRTHSVDSRKILAKPVNLRILICIQN